MPYRGPGMKIKPSKDQMDEKQCPRPGSVQSLPVRPPPRWVQILVGGRSLATRWAAEAASRCMDSACGEGAWHVTFVILPFVECGPPAGGAGVDSMSPVLRVRAACCMHLDAPLRSTLPSRRVCKIVDQTLALAHRI